VAVLRQGRVEVDPTTAARSQDLAACARIATELLYELAQLPGGAGTPTRAARKHLLQRIGAGVVRASNEALLTISRNHQQLAEGYDRVAIVHGSPLGSLASWSRTRPVLNFEMRHSMHRTRV